MVHGWLFLIVELATYLLPTELHNRTNSLTLSKYVVGAGKELNKRGRALSMKISKMSSSSLKMSIQALRR